MHCASLGEFEQGRPILESIRKNYPNGKMVLSFFSPSGYEIRKDYPGADLVVYLPLDTPQNARDFLELIQPDLVIFVKYEYWRNFFQEIRARGLPFLQVSAIFQPHQLFFRWYGRGWRKHLRSMTALFVQDKSSADLLNSIEVKQVIVSGDTRFDRVLAICNTFESISKIEQFCAGRNILVAGSTWAPDELALSALAERFSDLALIVAPHEIQEDHLQQLEKLFPDSIRYSALDSDKASHGQVLIIDNIGLLSRLYHYATICYVGGGFGAGIHNTLEAAVHGRPVIFGPHHQKFREAKELIACGGAFSIRHKEELILCVERLLENEEVLLQSSRAAADYVRQNSGSTETILRYIQEKRLLTS